MNPYTVQTARSTIDVGTVVIDGVQAGPVPGVPNADGVVPAARGKQIRYFRVPHQPTYWSCVSTQHVNAGVLSVVPNTHRPAVHTNTNVLTRVLEQQLRKQCCKPQVLFQYVEGKYGRHSTYTDFKICIHKL